MEIVKKTSLIKKLKNILKPVLFWLMPDVKKNDRALEHVSINIISNILGLGNAATPAGISAMSELGKVNENKKQISDSMMMLIVINTTSIQLIPTTIIAIRASLNSANPSNIIVPIWISTIVGTFMGIFITKLLIKRGKKVWYRQ